MLYFLMGLQHSLKMRLKRQCMALKWSSKHIKQEVMNINDLENLTNFSCIHIFKVVLLPLNGHQNI